MYSRSLGYGRRSLGAKIPIHAAPTELGWASGVVITINMALLTELDLNPILRLITAAGRHATMNLWPPKHNLGNTNARTDYE